MYKNTNETLSKSFKKGNKTKLYFNNNKYNKNSKLFNYGNMQLFKMARSIIFIITFPFNKKKST